MQAKKENVRKVIKDILDEENEGYGDTEVLDLLMGDKPFKSVNDFNAGVIEENMSQVFHDPSMIDKASIRLVRINNPEQRICIGYKVNNNDSSYENTCYIGFATYNNMYVKKD